MSSIPTLAYWEMRAWAEPSRYLLNYAGVEFIDKRYHFAEGPGRAYRLDKEWQSDKQSLGLDFPNIPYYIDEDIKLTQSLAILRYLGRKHGLSATDNVTVGRQDLVEQQLNDIRTDFAGICWSDDYETIREKYINETLASQLKLLSNFLGDNEWLVGKLTYVDFLGFETLDWIRLFSPEVINKFPSLKQYINRFENLPQIKSYRSSPNCKKWPVFAPNFKWGYYNK